ncbi:MAG: hypothetical protein AAF236_14070, partial [Verrucomicrobiota bacterium]
VGLAAAFPQRDFVVAHALKVAFHIAVGNFGTLAVLRPTWGRALRVILASVKATCFGVLPLALIMGLSWWAIPVALLGVAAVLTIFTCWHREDPPNTTRRWIAQVSGAAFVSLLGLFNL